MRRRLGPSRPRPSRRRTSPPPLGRAKAVVRTGGSVPPLDQVAVPVVHVPFLRFDQALSAVLDRCGRFAHVLDGSDVVIAAGRGRCAPSGWSVTAASFAAPHFFIAIRQIEAVDSRTGSSDLPPRRLIKWLAWPRGRPSTLPFPRFDQAPTTECSAAPTRCGRFARVSNEAKWDRHRPAVGARHQGWSAPPRPSWRAARVKRGRRSSEPGECHALSSDLPPAA